MCGSLRSQGLATRFDLRVCGISYALCLFRGPGFGPLRRRWRGLPGSREEEPRAQLQPGLGQVLRLHPKLCR